MKNNFFWEHKFLFLGLLILIAACLSPCNKYSLYNASTNEKIVSNTQINPYHINLPVSGYLTEPVTGPSRYFAGFYDYKKQLLSWLFWLVLLTIIFSVKKCRTRLQACLSKPKGLPYNIPIPFLILRNILLAICGFVVFVLYTVFVPLPTNQLKTSNPDYLVVDPHSHTHNSWDGLPTIKENIAWHQNKGFDVLFITEHDKLLPENELNNDTKNIVFPGIEINREGTHYLMLGTTDWNKIKNIAETSEMMTAVHDQGGIVIVAEYWHDKAEKIEHLVNYGVDGFEIVNGGFPYITEFYRKTILDTCKKYGLTLWASSDWHGWTNFTNYWNIIYIPGWRTLSTDAKTRLFMSTLNQQNSDIVTPIIYKQKQLKSFLRVLFEPFFDVYYYFSGLNWLQTLSWILWFCGIYFLYKSENLVLFRRTIFCVSGLALAGFFIFKGFGYYQYGKILVENKVLLNVSYTLFVTGILLIVLMIWNFIRSLRS